MPIRMNTRLKSLLIVAVAFIALLVVFKSTAVGSQALWSLSRGGTWLLPLVAVSSLVDSINPCAFSILLLTIAFLFSLGRLRDNILKIGLTYVLGIFVVYLLIGLGLLQALHLFNTPHFMAKIGAILLALVGIINLASHYIPSFPIQLKIPSVSHKKMAVLMERGSIPAAFGLGALVGLCEFPCTGGPYLMVLGLLHDKTTYLTGFLYLLLYNAIFVLPLVVLLLVASERSLLERVQVWRKRNMGQMKVISGVVMVLLGVIIFFL